MLYRGLLSVLCVLPVIQGVEYCSKLWNPHGNAILDRSMVLEPGSMQAVILYFCEQREITVQLWRKESETDFTLERQYIVQPPSAVPDSVIVDIADVTVTSNHFLGLYFSENRYLPVSLEFIQSGTQTASEDTMPAGESYVAGQVYKFDNVHFPYRVHMAGCELEDCSDQDIQLPSGQGTPPPPPPIECDDGELIGEDNRAIIQENVAFAAMRVRAVLTYFCTDFDVDMHVWQPESGDTYRLVNSVRLINPADADNGDLVLIELGNDAFDITSDQRIGFYMSVPGQKIPIVAQPTNGASDGPVIVKAGVQGPYTEQDVYQFDDLPFPFEFQFELCQYPDSQRVSCLQSVNPAENTTTTTLTTPLSGASSSYSPVSPSGPSGVTGYTTDFAVLPGYPGEKGVKGRRGLTGLPGDTGDVGSQGPHNDVTGVKGYKGDLGVGPEGQKGRRGEPGVDNTVRGALGEKGNVGNVGLPGPVGPKGLLGAPGFMEPDAAAVTDEECDCGGLLDKKVVLGLLIWAIILTIILLALIIIATRTNRR